MGLFKLGETYITRGVSEITKDPEMEKEVQACIKRHSEGDWGDISEHDKQVNTDGLAHGDQLLSSYLVKGQKVWIITEGNRSVTTILLPSEY